MSMGWIVFLVFIILWYVYVNNDEIKTLKKSKDSLGKEIDRLRAKLDAERQESLKYYGLYLENLPQPKLDFRRLQRDKS